MEPHDQRYKAEIFSGRHKLSWRAPIVCASIKKIFAPTTVIDAGCGIGDTVKEFCRIGIDAKGIEGSETALPHLVCPPIRLLIWDLRRPMPPGEAQYDVVVCLEVAEHIDPDYVDIFISNLKRLAKQWIIMSASPPGTEGDHGHVNCQLPQYWIDKMVWVGFRRRENMEDLIKKEWDPWRRKRGMNWYYNHLLIFERKDG